MGSDVCILTNIQCTVFNYPLIEFLLSSAQRLADDTSRDALVCSEPQLRQFLDLDHSAAIDEVVSSFCADAELFDVIIDALASSLLLERARRDHGQPREAEQQRREGEV